MKRSLTDLQVLQTKAGMLFVLQVLKICRRVIFGKIIQEELKYKHTLNFIEF